MDNKTALIFGASGQDGIYLGRLLQQQNVVVTSVSRNHSPVSGDVGDYERVTSLVKQQQPDFIFHLAANSSTRHDRLFENHQTIDTGTLNILESARLSCPQARIFLSGTALQFRNDGGPINEATPFEGLSAYAVSRIQSVYAARYYRQAFGLQVYTGYFFNHDSPFRSEAHVNQKIVKAVLRIAAGSQEKLMLGDIEVQKEFNFAGDIMDAVWTLVNQETIFEAVLGSGQAYRIHDWLVYCFEKQGLDWKDSVILQPDFISPYRVLVSDPQLIRSLGWQPKTDFFQLANLMMNE